MGKKARLDVSLTGSISLYFNRYTFTLDIDFPFYHAKQSLSSLSRTITTIPFNCRTELSKGNHT